MKIDTLTSSTKVDIHPTKPGLVTKSNAISFNLNHDDTFEDCSVSTEIVLDKNNNNNGSNSAYELKTDARDDDSACSVQTERCLPDVEDREDAAPLTHVALPVMSEESTKVESNKPFIKQKGTKTKKSGHKYDGIAKDTESTFGQVPKNIDNTKWCGRIVGLFLPPDVDPAFDEIAKPSICRRVDPSLFRRTSCHEGNVSFWGSGQWNPWHHGMPVLNGCKDYEAGHGGGGDAPSFSIEKPDKDKEGSISLDIYLFDQNNADVTKVTKIHMVRNPNEEISKTCQRIQISLEKKVGNSTKGKRKKKKGGQEVLSLVPLLLEKQDTTDDGLVEEAEAIGMDYILESFTISLCTLCNSTGPSPDLAYGQLEGYKPVGYTQNTTISDAIHNAKGNSGRHALCIPITVSEANTVWVPLMLDSCPPTITSVSTFGSFQHTHIFERTPIVIECTCLYATHVQISWFADGNEVCPDSSWYAPMASDVGKKLTVVLVPKRPGHNGMGCAEAYEFQKLVEPLPDMPVMSLREGWKGQKTSNDDDGASNLRVVTYNILADQNASRDVEKEHESDRIYSHCEFKHIVKWRRHALIVHELLDYHPHIVCLQEVDADVFRDLLHPVMNVMGYQGYYSQKGVGVADGVREGCALFWSLDVFESVRVPDMQSEFLIVATTFPCISESERLIVFHMTCEAHTFREMIEAFSCEERMHKNQWKSLRDMSYLLEKHEHLRNVLFNKLGHVLQTVVLTKRCDGEKVVVGKHFSIIFIIELKNAWK